MKKSQSLFLAIALGVLLLAFAGCKKKEDGKVTVVTKVVTEINATSAKCGGNVTLTGNPKVGVCGVCWSESPSPTTNDYFTTDIVGAGEFISTMSNLRPNTKYYVRAYATLDSYIMYGEEMDFTTLSDGGGNGGGGNGGGTGGDGTLSVTTNDVSEITASSAICGGNVIANGEVTVSARGVCWSASHTPTLENAHTNDGQGVGAFASNLTGLAASTVYYVRAYATNNLGITTYGGEKFFTTQAGGGGGGNGTLSVTTNDASEITASSAICGGNVIANGEVTVSARGVCWGTSHTPTLENAHTNDGQGVGPFTSNLTGLAASTVYYVRAYATNITGLTTYGNEISFTTQNSGGGTQGELPIVITYEVTEITDNSSRCSGEVTSDGGNPVTARGICWSTSPNPTLGNNTAFGGMGTGPFTTQMTNLEIGTTYYVKAYATNSVGTAFGNEVSFTTKGLPPQGAVNGLFSVSENKKVYFSQGNLQYQASTNIWRFAEHQWDYIGGDYYYSTYVHGNIPGTVNGSSNNDISPTYSGWIDEFGWGTSGRNHGAVCYQPWSSSTNNSDYYAYGSPSSNLSDYTGEADWGYNAISNGGNQIGLWRTLTQTEWDYVLNQRRTNSNMLYVCAQVNNINGIILLPDNWNPSIYILNSGSYSSNIISATTWVDVLQANGAVFLPKNYFRIGTELEYSASILGGISAYWSATSEDDNNAFCVQSGLASRNFPKNYGLSVRLVYDY